MSGKVVNDFPKRSITLRFGPIFQNVDYGDKDVDFSCVGIIMIILLSPFCIRKQRDKIFTVTSSLPLDKCYFKKNYRQRRNCCGAIWF